MARRRFVGSACLLAVIILLLSVSDDSCNYENMLNYYVLFLCLGL